MKVAVVLDSAVGAVVVVDVVAEAVAGAVEVETTWPTLWVCMYPYLLIRQEAVFSHFIYAFSPLFLPV